MRLDLPWNGGYSYVLGGWTGLEALDRIKGEPLVNLAGALGEVYAVAITVTERLTEE